MTEIYHTHTARCLHASGTDEEYVEKAIAEDVKLLGFSDHAPYIYRDGYVSYYKMLPSMADEYFDSILSLREKYRDKIDIRVGYEAEYYPELWDDTLELWRKRPPEYLILGQHYINYESLGGVRGDRSYNSSAPADKARVKLYVDRVVEAMASERFSIVAHPDIVSSSADDGFYLNELSRIVGASEKYGVPLEFNLLGFATGRLYPRMDFWRMVAEMGGSCVLGCDAHSPMRVADKDEERRARELLKSLGVPVIETVELRDPKL